MRIKKLCEICGKDFWAIKTTQIYDTRRCFKRAYYLKNKEILQYQKQHPNYPSKTCAFCQERSVLPFDPTMAPILFNKWGCPFCHVTNEIVWKFQDKVNSYQMIASFVMVSMQQENTSTIQESTSTS